MDHSYGNNRESTINTNRLTELLSLLDHSTPTPQQIARDSELRDFLLSNTSHGSVRRDATQRRYFGEVSSPLFFQPHVSHFHRNNEPSEALNGQTNITERRVTFQNDELTAIYSKLNQISEEYRTHAFESPATLLAQLDKAQLSDQEQEKLEKYTDSITTDDMQQPVRIRYTDKNKKTHYDILDLETIREWVTVKKEPVNPLNRQKINVSNLSAVDEDYLSDLKTLLGLYPKGKEGKQPEQKETSEIYQKNTPYQA